MTKPAKIAATRACEGQLLQVTLDAPPANVLDSQMLSEIERTVDEHAASPGLKAVVFTGAGNHFSFGASVQEHRAERVAEMLAQFHGLFRRLDELGVPTFAVVGGKCLGGGLELAAYCTWLFSTPDASFGQPEIKLAVFPPMASVLLPWRVGGGVAADLCVSGRTVGAEEAHRMGLVNDISDDPMAACMNFFGEHIAPLSASSLRFAERAVRTELRRALKHNLQEVERMYVDELMKTADANEGINAFLEKRRPVFGERA